VKAQRAVLCLACSALVPRAFASAQTPNEVDEPPVLLSQPQVDYRPCLQDAGMHGRAVVRLMVDTTGHVEDTSVVLAQSAGTILDSLATAASRGLVFRPARVGGLRVRMPVVLPFDFGAGAPVGASTDSGVFSADCVDREPGLKSMDRVRYPESARIREIVGEAVLEFVVDTNGRAEPRSVRLVNAPHPDFARSARTALASARFTPARLSGEPVRCRVRLPIVFQIARFGGERPPSRKLRPNELPPVTVEASW
jgi:TonB family protein